MIVSVCHGLQYCIRRAQPWCRRGGCPGWRRAPGLSRQRARSLERRLGAGQAAVAAGPTGQDDARVPAEVDQEDTAQRHTHRAVPLHTATGRLLRAGRTKEEKSERGEKTHDEGVRRPALQAHGRHAGPGPDRQAPDDRSDRRRPSKATAPATSPAGSCSSLPRRLDRRDMRSAINESVSDRHLEGLRRGAGNTGPTSADDASAWAKLRRGGGGCPAPAANPARRQAAWPRGCGRGMAAVRKAWQNRSFFAPFLRTGCRGASRFPTFPRAQQPPRPPHPG